MSLDLFDAALRGTVFALLALLAQALWRDRPRLPAARAGVALCVGMALQVFGSAPHVETTLPMLLQVPLVAVAVGNAVLFWIFVAALFDDEFRLRPVHVLSWCAVAAISAFNCTVGTGPVGTLLGLLRGAQRLAPLLFAVLAAAAALRHWRADLVEPRRRLRAWLVGSGIAYSLAMLAVRLSTGEGRLGAVASLVDMLALLVMVAPVAWQLLRLGASELFPLPPVGVTAAAAGTALPPASAAAPEPADGSAGAEPAEAPDLADERLAAALQHAMEVERAYRSENLTVAALAARLRVPEYRLRRHINQRLGHRNFNAYVNAFRLDEARAALADPAQRQLPVLTIALTAGFQSIGPFNRAFKAATGLTPTEFRREKLADS